MKHIKSESEEEASADNLYKKASDETPIKVTKDGLAALRDYVSIVEQIDELTLKASEIRGRMKAEMGAHALLVDENGKTLVSWKNGGARKKIEIDGLILEANIPPDIVQKHTTIVSGSRSFSVKLE